MFIIPFSCITINTLICWSLHIYLPVCNLSVKTAVCGCLFKLASVAERAAERLGHTFPSALCCLHDLGMDLSLLSGV